MKIVTKTFWIFFIFLTFFLIASCEEISILKTSKKHSRKSNSILSAQAESNFWHILHEGNYAKIEEADKLLTAAYLENPNDSDIAAHLGFLHIWKITERQREKNLSPLIVNEIILARKYFADSLDINPNEARYLGFFADSQLVEGKIFRDEREQIRGYFNIKKAIELWPEFNYFAGGFVLSALPHTSKLFQQGLEWQWKTLDVCSENKISRTNPDFSPYMQNETLTGKKRACWNSWKAPFNFEGFFLNMGDMLVKSGDWSTAIKIYQNAKLAKNYSSWPYKNLLEKRIADAKKNVTHFQQDLKDSEKTILFNSGRGCVACHQSNTHS